MSNQSISRKIRSLRGACTMSQQELAQALGVSRNYICQIETGKRVPSIKLLHGIARFFDVTIEYIVSEDELIQRIRGKLSREDAVAAVDFLNRLGRGASS